MARRLDAREWQVVAVDRDQRHLYQPGLLFIPFGIYKPADVIKPKRQFLSNKVKVIFDTIGNHRTKHSTASKSQARRMRFTTTNWSSPLVATLRRRKPPACWMPAGGRMFSIFTPWTAPSRWPIVSVIGRVGGWWSISPRCRSSARLRRWSFFSWRTGPFNNAACRNKVELIYATPLSGAFTKPRAAATLSDLLDRKGIRVVCRFCRQRRG